MKGYQKKVIYLKNVGSQIFDEAYFIVSRDKESAKDTNDMVIEANRIIEESLNQTVSDKRKDREIIFFLLPFFLGALLSAAVFALANLLI